MVKLRPLKICITFYKRENNNKALYKAKDVYCTLWKQPVQKVIKVNNTYFDICIYYY